jgi:hypothetical protein
VKVADDVMAEKVFGLICRGGRPESPPNVDLLFFDDEVPLGQQGWRFSKERLGKVNMLWIPPWKSVLCVETKKEIVGHYGSEPLASAQKVTWNIRLVRISDGKEFKTQVSADPPEEGDAKWGAAGDPMPLLIDWLKSGEIQE